MKKVCILMEHLSKATSLFWKSRENFRETSGVFRQLPSSSLYEISKERPIFCGNNEILAWHISIRENEMNSNSLKKILRN